MQTELEVFIGTKAQLIKMAPVMLELEKRGIDYYFTLTGQHENTMSDLIKSFGITTLPKEFLPMKEADSNLKILFWLWNAAKKIVTSKRVLTKHVVLVHGDTLSTLLGAIYAKKIGGMVGHVEAGLRSQNYFHPFPEELIRVLVSKLTDYHYCPGDIPLNNLQGVSGQLIDTKKNTILDTIQLAESKHSMLRESHPSFAVISIHRFENLNNVRRLQKIVDIFLEISKEISLKFILHPVTTKILKRKNLYRKLSEAKHITLCERMNYFEFSKLLVNSKFLITDGGSNQEEAHYMGLPCLLMRNATERNEGLNENVVLSKYDHTIVWDFVNTHKAKEWKFKKLQTSSPSKIIVDHLCTI